VTAGLGSLHGFAARALLAYAVVLGVWGAYRYFRNQELSGGFRASFLIMAGLTAVQGLLGLATFLLGSRPTELLHVVYGIFAVVFLPGTYLYSQNGSRRREAVILAGAAWIVSIAYLRGIATA
jgi:FtsH-binding integral membrane protein